MRIDREQWIATAVIAAVIVGVLLILLFVE